MATFYTGPRPVLKGRSTGDMVNPHTSMSGKAKSSGVYSYYPLYSTSRVLDGAPDNDNEPGSGNYPGNRFLSQLFEGSTLYSGTTPLAGTFLDGVGLRFAPKQYKGLSGARVFASDFGHDKRSLYYGNYSNYIFDGIESAEAFADTGHSIRAIGAAGTANSFGAFGPNEQKGVTSSKVFTDGYGVDNVAGDYGRYKVQEYKGVTSAKAL